MVDFSKIHTYNAFNRTNLVTLSNMMNLEDSVDYFNHPDFELLIDRIITARQQSKPVIFSMGAHVIKSGLSRFIIALMDMGILTHIASNGAGSIHDFEICYLEGTSEDVPTAIEDGSFGMWEQTGRWMNEALCEGAELNLGYGEALARYIDRNKNNFPHRKECVLYQAWKHEIPATYHVAIGTDIIHQHPIANFSAIGKTSGIDFHTFCNSVSQLNKGVYLNFGSSVIGPEVFLKALSITRNLGFETFHITTANFDLVDLGDFRCKISDTNPDYYYRPRKNIINRPTSQGGIGWHFTVDHKISIPNLYARLKGKV